MRFKKLIAISAVGLGALSATGATMASGQASPSKSGTEVNQTADTDDVQEGDQTADTDDVQEGDQTSPDVSGSESTSETESDAPGGHADAVGNVDHQFDGEE